MVRHCVSRFSGLQEPSKGKRTEPGTKFISRSVERKAFLFYSLLFTSALVMECFLRTKRSYNKRKKTIGSVTQSEFFFQVKQLRSLAQRIPFPQSKRIVLFRKYSPFLQTPRCLRFFLVRYVLVNILS